MLFRCAGTVWSDLQRADCAGWGIAGAGCSGDGECECWADGCARGSGPEFAAGGSGGSAGFGGISRHPMGSWRGIVRCREGGAPLPLRLGGIAAKSRRSEEHTSELQSLMRISYAVFCLKKKIKIQTDVRAIRLNTNNHTIRNPA